MVRRWIVMCWRSSSIFLNLRLFSLLSLPLLQDFISICLVLSYKMTIPLSSDYLFRLVSTHIVGSANPGKFSSGSWNRCKGSSFERCCCTPISLYGQLEMLTLQHIWTRTRRKNFGPIHSWWWTKMRAPLTTKMFDFDIRAIYSTAIKKHFRVFSPALFR